MPEIKIQYENIPRGIMAGSTTTGNDPQSIVNFDDFKTIRNVPKYATLEQGRNLLDGSFINVPANTNYGYVSSIITDSNGDFAEDIIITRTYNMNYSSAGIYFEFDYYTDDHPSTFNVKWYRDTTLLEDQTYTCDNAQYFCSTPVVAYNKIVATFSNMTKASRLLKIYNIYDGISRNFFNEEIQNLEIIEDLNANSEAIAINEATVDLIPNDTTGVFFQRTLPFKIYRGDDLYCYFFINKSSSNYNNTKYSIRVDDLIHVLDGQTYLGGIYNGTTASSLIADILGDLPYTLDASLGSKTITGYLPICTKREALSQVAFCINAKIDTSRSENIVIEPLSTTVARTITDAEILDIQVTQENIVTQNVLNVDTIYQKTASAEDLFNGAISGTQYITFDEPKYNLVATNCTIQASGANWCILTGSSANAKLTGKAYEHSMSTYTKSNTYVVSTDLEKTETFETTLTWNSATLIDSIPFIEFKIRAKFLMGTSKVGDLVNIGDYTARIKTLSYNIAQTNIYADAELEVYYE